MNRTSVSFVLSVLIVLAVPSLYAADGLKPHENAPVLSFDGQTVKASNVTPGGQVVFFAVGRVPFGWGSDIVRWAQAVSDEDRDGTVTFDAGQAVPCKSIWVAAEVQNAHFTVASPPECHLRRAPLDKKSLRKNGKGELELFFHERPYLDLLYVHPGQGAWVVSAADSYDTDADGESNGVTAIALSKARSLSGDAPPKNFGHGGVVVAIDLYKLDVVAERLDANTLALGEVQQ